MDHDTVGVTALARLDGHSVRLTFSDGAQRERDLTALLTGPVFEAIRADPVEFARVGIDAESGVLCWPNGADIDAELLRYDDLWEQVVGLTRTA